MGPMLTRSSVQSLVTHGKAWIDQRADVRLHYVTAGEGGKVAVLLHGAPETWHAWRRLIEPLTSAGYRLVMPDYRGAGGSTKPLGGYDKWTMVRGHPHPRPRAPRDPGADHPRRSRHRHDD